MSWLSKAGVPEVALRVCHSPLPNGPLLNVRVFLVFFWGGQGQCKDKLKKAQTIFQTKGITNHRTTEWLRHHSGVIWSNILAQAGPSLKTWHKILLRLFLHISSELAVLFTRSFQKYICYHSSWTSKCRNSPKHALPSQSSALRSLEVQKWQFPAKDTQCENIPWQFHAQ